jgi:hypothetical protein
MNSRWWLPASSRILKVYFLKREYYLSPLLISYAWKVSTFLLENMTRQKYTTEVHISGRIKKLLKPSHNL